MFSDCLVCNDLMFFWCFLLASSTIKVTFLFLTWLECHVLARMLSGDQFLQKKTIEVQVFEEQCSLASFLL